MFDFLYSFSSWRVGRVRLAVDLLHATCHVFLAMCDLLCDLPCATFRVCVPLRL
jgi:hypothetical protein